MPFWQWQKLKGLTLIVFDICASVFHFTFMLMVLTRKGLHNEVRCFEMCINLLMMDCPEVTVWLTGC